jgi:spore coat protein U-like protein
VNKGRLGHLSLNIGMLGGHRIGRLRAIAAAGVLATSAIGLSALPAAAATATTTFTVSATVQATCSISANNLTFGAYSGALINSTASLSINCTNTTPYNIGLSAGSATGATVTTRKMTTGGNTISYALYRDGGHTSNWGNTVGADTATGTGSGSAQALTIYGQMAAGQISAPGSYIDTVTATVTY